MKAFTPEQLFIQLRELDEEPRIEAKRGSDIGDSVMQTVCAFANEPGLGGGYLLLGIHQSKEQPPAFEVCGVINTDQLLNNLQINCRDQFEQPISVQAEVEWLEGKKVIVVFVPELNPAAKPCCFKGKFDGKNKRKTGVWRRRLNGDYECTQSEMTPLLLAKTGLGFEQVMLPDAQWDDLASEAITLYRNLRAKVRPHAEELQASDADMLRALNLVQHRNGQWVPNKESLWPVIVWLCALQPYTADKLASILNRQMNPLKSAHLNVLREEKKLIGHTYAEVPNHPEQAYQTLEKGRTWLKQQDVGFNE